MTVKELIKELSLVDPNLKVAIASSNIGYGHLLREVISGDACAEHRYFVGVGDERSYIELDDGKSVEEAIALGDIDTDEFDNIEPVIWLFGENT